MNVNEIQVLPRQFSNKKKREQRLFNTSNVKISFWLTLCYYDNGKTTAQHYLRLLQRNNTLNNSLHQKLYSVHKFSFLKYTYIHQTHNFYSHTNIQSNKTHTWPIKNIHITALHIHILTSLFESLWSYWKTWAWHGRRGSFLAFFCPFLYAADFQCSDLDFQINCDCKLMPAFGTILCSTERTLSYLRETTQ